MIEEVHLMTITLFFIFEKIFFLLCQISIFYTIKPPFEFSINTSIENDEITSTTLIINNLK